MLRRTVARRCAASPPPPPPSASSASSSADAAAATLLQQLRDRRPTKLSWWLCARAVSRWQMLLACGAMITGAAVIYVPEWWRERQEARHGRFVPLDASTMPRTSPQWWENEWMKGSTMWRAGESVNDFYVAPYAYVKAQTGRDLSTAALFRATHPSSPPPPPPQPQQQNDNVPTDASSSSPWRRVASLVPLASRLYALSRRRSSGDDGAAAAPPRVLVPLCGDSPILRTMVLQGYEVDGVDVSETAMRAAVERTERALPVTLYDRVHLHLSDFFAPELWQSALRGRTYDVIYDHKSIVALPLDKRADYVALLKRVLKDDGLIYVEGIYRTGRVKGNKHRGPPFALSPSQLAELYPEREGYFVRCQETNDAMLQLSRENRLLQRIPKSMYATPYHCVVFREATVNLATRNAPLGGDAAAPTPPPGSTAATAAAT